MDAIQLVELHLGRLLERRVHTDSRRVHERIDAIRIDGLRERAEESDRERGVALLVRDLERQRRRHAPERLQLGHDRIGPGLFRRFIIAS